MQNPGDTQYAGPRSLFQREHLDSKGNEDQNQVRFSVWRAMGAWPRWGLIAF